MSYLLFTAKYTRALIDIGYRDADARIDEIEEFLYSDSNPTSGTRGQASRSKPAARKRV
jgi:NTE family protein